MLATLERLMRLPGGGNADDTEVPTEPYPHPLRPALERTVALVARQRETSALHAMAIWAMRVGTSGWAMVRQGTLKVTNRAFDALDRGCVIGPRWHVLDPTEWTTDDDGPGQTLVDIALAETRRLGEQRLTTSRWRAVRGQQVVELTFERSMAGAPEEPMVLCIARDVTDLAQSEAQLAGLQARLLEKERAGLAGSVAVRVAHDLGNLVGALSAHLLGLHAGAVADAETVEALSSIVQAQAALVNKLRSMANTGPEPTAVLRMRDDIVKPALQMVDVWLRGAGGRSVVRPRIDPSLEQAPPVRGVRDDLINVVINLVLNARDAMPDGGSVVIGAESHPGAVMLWVDDQGTGIPENQLERIFEPFVSTKGKGGMGMGLAMARQILRREGGDITARNRPEGGARFELRFPAIGDQPSPRESFDAPEALSNGRATSETTS